MGCWGGREADEEGAAEEKEGFIRRFFSPVSLPARGCSVDACLSACTHQVQSISMCTHTIAVKEGEEEGKQASADTACQCLLWHMAYQRIQ